MGRKKSAEADRRNALKQLLSDVPADVRNAVVGLSYSSLSPFDAQGEPSWERVQSWFTHEPVLKLMCVKPVVEANGVVRPPYRDEEFGRAQHLLLINPDGLITALSHPDAVDDAGGTLMLGALGGYAPTCLAVADTLAHGTEHAWADVWNNKRRLSIFYACARWAAAGVPLREAASLVNVGATPQQWQPWHEAGWSMQAAAAFLNEGVPLEQAQPWQATGRTDRIVLYLAGQGEGPDALGPWERTGLNRTTISKWENWLELGPDLLTDLVRAGFSPGQLLRLPFRPGPDQVRELVDWAQAGVIADDVHQWQQIATQQDAVMLSRAGFGPYWYQNFRSTEHVLLPKHRSGYRMPAADLIAWARLGARAEEDWEALHRSHVTPAVSPEEFEREAALTRQYRRLPFGQVYPLVEKQVVARREASISPVAL